MSISINRRNGAFMAQRVFQVAKSLGIPSKDIIRKLIAEELPHLPTATNPTATTSGPPGARSASAWRK